MVDYTARIKLPRLDASGAEMQSDYPNIQREFANILDSTAGFSTFTSTTRPSAPYVGQTILETDTGFVRYYCGDTGQGADGWVWCGGRKMFVSYYQTTASTQQIPNAVTTIIDYQPSQRGNWLGNPSGSFNWISPPTAAQGPFILREAGMYRFSCGIVLAGGTVETWAIPGNDAQAWRGRVGSSGSSSVFDLTSRATKDSTVNHIVYQNSGALQPIVRTGDTPWISFEFLGASA